MSELNKTRNNKINQEWWTIDTFIIQTVSICLTLILKRLLHDICSQIYILIDNHPFYHYYIFTVDNIFIGSYDELSQNDIPRDSSMPHTMWTWGTAQPINEELSDSDDDVTHVNEERGRGRSKKSRHYMYCVVWNTQGCHTHLENTRLLYFLSQFCIMWNLECFFIPEPLIMLFEHKIILIVLLKLTNCRNTGDVRV